MPAVITVGLSDGAVRLARKKVIVKRLEAIEDVGNVDTLCTDKTGTLTQNEIKVQDVVDPEDHSRPKLIKYAPLCNTAVVEGVENQAILDAMYRSAATNKEVEVEWDFQLSYATVPDTPKGPQDLSMTRGR